MAADKVFATFFIDFMNSHIFRAKNVNICGHTMIMFMTDISAYPISHCDLNRPRNALSKLKFMLN